MIVHSLVCWGGRTGKTVTLSIASPCVVTSTSHGLRDGTRLVFSTTGALPTGITAGTTYYAKSTDANTFNLYTDSGLTSIVNTSGTQSGTHTAKSVLMSEYFAQYPGRWGESASERCYDGVASFCSARTGATTGFDEEVCEVGEAFYTTSPGSILVARSPHTVITSMLAGERTEAFHNGSIDAGFVLLLPGSVANVSIDTEIEGISVQATNSASALYLYDANASIRNCVVFSNSKIGIGIGVYGTKGRAQNNLLFNLNQGCVNYGGAWSIVANNIAAKCNYGFRSNADSLTNRRAFWFNNLAVGSVTANWGVEPTSLDGATNNFGVVDDAIPPWAVGSGTVGAIQTTDFADYENNDFRPASATSPQVDAGILYYGIPTADIVGAEVPNYNNGGAEGIDIGCYEFDHGYGNHPASTTVTFSGVLAGSEIHVYDSEDNELVGTESCTANQSLTWGIPANPNVKVTIIKRGLRWMKLTYLSEEGLQTIPIFPQPDLGYNNPA